MMLSRIVVHQCNIINSGVKLHHASSCMYIAKEPTASFSQIYACKNLLKHLEPAKVASPHLNEFLSPPPSFFFLLTVELMNPFAAPDVAERLLKSEKTKKFMADPKFQQKLRDLAKGSSNLAK